MIDKFSINRIYSKLSSFHVSCSELVLNYFKVYFTELFYVLYKLNAMMYHVKSYVDWFSISSKRSFFYFSPKIKYWENVIQENLILKITLKNLIFITDERMRLYMFLTLLVHWIQKDSVGEWSNNIIYHKAVNLKVDNSFL